MRNCQRRFVQTFVSAFDTADTDTLGYMSTMLTVHMGEALLPDVMGDDVAIAWLDHSDDGDHYLTPSSTQSVTPMCPSTSL